MQPEEPNLDPCRHFNLSYHAHELTFSCFKNRPFLKSERAGQFLAQAISKASLNYQFDLWAYVFMYNHLHLLLWPKLEQYSILRILLAIKQPVAQKITYHLKHLKPDSLKYLATGQKGAPFRFWQDGAGYDRNIVSRDALISAVNYIHNNPVRRGLVISPDNWLWSSYKDWQTEDSGPVHINLSSFPNR